MENFCTFLLKDTKPQTKKNIELQLRLELYSNRTKRKLQHINYYAPSKNNYSFIFGNDQYLIEYSKSNFNTGQQMFFLSSRREITSLIQKSEQKRDTTNK